MKASPHDALRRGLITDARYFSFRSYVGFVENKPENDYTGTPLYGKTHVPIHYVLIVGYDDTKEKFYLHGCSCNNVQEVKYTDLMKSVDVKVPGRSRNNTIRIFELPDNLPGDAKVSEKGLKHKAERMLKPSVSMLGIPAMRKLAGEIVSWQDKECFDHKVAYAGMTPPHTIAYSINYHTLSLSGSLDTI